jgi:hypothetical protein
LKLNIAGQWTQWLCVWGQNEATAIKGVAELSRSELVVVGAATATVK